MIRRISDRWDGDRRSDRGLHLPKPSVVFTILAALWPYAISFGDQGVTFTVYNRTEKYLHVIVNNTPFLYIAPGRVVTYHSDNLGNIVAEAFYSPGQDVSGSAERTFQAVEVTNSTASQSSTCTSTSNNGSNCESTTGGSSSTTVAPLTWEVQPGDLTSHEGGG